jgi:hypothetical protein
MKKHVKHESLLNTVARSVGRAAGTIAKATQDFAEDAAAVVQTVKVKTANVKTLKAKGAEKSVKKTVKTAKAGRHKPRRAPAHAVGSRASKRKLKATKSVTRRSRTRA